MKTSHHSSYTYKEGDLWKVLTHYGWKIPGSKMRWQTIACGLHEDRTPSCRVNDASGGVTCFSCGFKGDAVGLIRHIEGVGWREAYSECESITVGDSIEVSGQRSIGSNVSFNSGDNRRGGTYVPPRVRGR